MAGSKTKFAEATYASQKGKAIVRVNVPPPKPARHADKIIVLPPPPLPTTEEVVPTQLESSSKGVPIVAPVLTDPPRESAKAKVVWP